MCDFSSHHKDFQSSPRNISMIHKLTRKKALAGSSLCRLHGGKLQELRAFKFFESEYAIRRDIVASLWKDEQRGLSLARDAVLARSIILIGDKRLL